MRIRLGIMTVAAVLVLAACGQDDEIELGETAADEPTADEPTADEATPDEDDDAADDDPGDEGEADPAGDPDEADEVEEPTDEAETEAETEADPEDGPEPVGELSTDEVATDDFPGGGADIAFLTDVRVGAHDGFDRIVLELEGDEPPSYRVALVDPPILEDGSGHEVDVDGEAFLELRLAPASRVDLAEEEPDVIYQGPDRVDGDVTAAVTEVVLTGDFEANLAWVAGLTGERPFAVTMLEDPMRLVVDVEAG